MKRIIAIVFAVTVCLTAKAQQVNKETFLYSEKGGEKLYLDKYETEEKREEPKPCIIFVHGGHFSFGDRGKPGYYFEDFARRGFTVFSISYRLGFKGLSAENISTDNVVSMAEMFENTINMAVEDFFDATNFVLANAKNWNIDSDMIIANGSSAGAVTVLQAEYYICNDYELAKKLPKGFNYAGICAFAGAILARDGMTWAKKPCPIQMFQGDADKAVPYGALEVQGIWLCGSGYVASTLREAQTPYWLYTVSDVGHAVAESPFRENRKEIMDFYESYVVAGNPMMVETIVRIVGRKEVNKDFTVEDFMRTTFEAVAQAEKTK